MLLLVIGMQLKESKLHIIVHTARAHDPCTRDRALVLTHVYPTYAMGHREYRCLYVVVDQTQDTFKKSIRIY